MRVIPGTHEVDFSEEIAAIETAVSDVVDVHLAPGSTEAEVYNVDERLRYRIQNKLNEAFNLGLRYAQVIMEDSE